jgi:hypothetical protein
MVNPWVILMAVGALLIVGASSFIYGGHVKENAMIANQAKADRIRKETVEAAREGAAIAISQIKIKNVTIRQNLETVTRENVVYRECRHDASGLRLLNEALTGATQPVDNGSVPGTATAD